MAPERTVLAPPPQLSGAELHADIPFLQPERDWERMDVYIPKAAKSDKLPCIVLIYGGGYGGKRLPYEQVAPLLARGYVLAVPDYALNTDNPAVLAAWDIGNAVRFLRENAAKYRIDPERIGAWGFSAGGWIAQNLFYSDVLELARLGWEHDHNGGGLPKEKQKKAWMPYIDPEPLYPGHSTRVQAVASDWGAYLLVEQKYDPALKRDVSVPAKRLSADDPPLMTCFSGRPHNPTQSSVGFLKALGVPAEPIFMDVKSTHVPGHKEASLTLDGTATTWGEAIGDFFDRHVKKPTVCTAPEIVLAGEQVRLLSVHPGGAIHFTTNGETPTAQSPVYKSPLPIAPGTVIQAIATRPGLAPSPVARLKLPRQLVIEPSPVRYTAKVGQPFRATFTGKGGKLNWLATGRLGEYYSSWAGQKFNPARQIRWLSMDTEQGILSGTPRRPGVYPVILGAWTQAEPIRATGRLIIITVEP